VRIDPLTARRNFAASQFVGFWIFGRYVSVRGPEYRPLFSERNRIRTRILPLLGGWRVVVRRSQVG